MVKNTLITNLIVFNILDTHSVTISSSSQICEKGVLIKNATIQAFESFFVLLVVTAGVFSYSIYTLTHKSVSVCMEIYLFNDNLTLKIYFRTFLLFA